MRRLLAVAAIVFALGCSDSTGPEATVNGVWRGILDGNTITVTLSQSGTEVTGTGSISGSVVNAAMTASGTFVKPDVSLNFDFVGYTDINVNGSLAGDRITGSASGSGYSNNAITFNRDAN